MKIGFYPITANLHTKETVAAQERQFLQAIEERLGQPIFTQTMGTAPLMDLTLLNIRTGGTEGQFKEIYQRLPEPYILLASGQSNSLAASLEILSFLKQQGKKAEVLHGDPAIIAARIKMLGQVLAVKKRLQGMRLGVIGRPSDWLISSSVDYAQVKQVLGVELVDISMDELVEAVEQQSDISERPQQISSCTAEQGTIDGALRIYQALKTIIGRHHLQGITVRCFDLLGRYRNTGCLAMSLLNDEDIVAGCEGDIPALLSMVILNAVTGEPVFMSNPSAIDIDSNEITLAHCTLPMSMADRYEFDTHFESGLGIGIRGTIRQGRSTIFKLAPDCQRFFVSGADLVDNPRHSNMCRTQITLKLDEDVQYFLRDPIGNHHLVSRGDHAELIREFFRWL